MCYTIHSRNLLINHFFQNKECRTIDIPKILELKYYIENAFRGAMYVDACIDSLVEAVELEDYLEWQDDYTIILVHDLSQDTSHSANRLIPADIKDKYMEVIAQYEQV